MSTAFWIVVEGDNGTGKSTVASLLAEAGWFCVNRHPEVVACLEHARASSLEAQHEAYLELDRVSARIALACTERSILVRYWPSTAAAAFADGRTDWSGFVEMVRSLRREMPEPSLYVELTCALPERSSRIKARGLIQNQLDDTTERRSGLHRRALGHIAHGVGNWAVVDTSLMAPDDVARRIGLLACAKGCGPDIYSPLPGGIGP